MFFYLFAGSVYMPYVKKSCHDLQKDGRDKCSIYACVYHVCCIGRMSTYPSTLTFFYTA